MLVFRYFLESSNLRKGWYGGRYVTMLLRLMLFLHLFFLCSPVSYGPIFVPFAILLIETVPWRKKVLKIFLGIGMTVRMYLLYFMITDPVISQVVRRSIHYNTPHLYIFLIMTFYLLSTCISGFFQVTY